MDIYSAILLKAFAVGKRDSRSPGSQAPRIDPEDQSSSVIVIVVFVVKGSTDPEDLFIFFKRVHCPDTFRQRF